MVVDAQQGSEASQTGQATPPTEMSSGPEAARKARMLLEGGDLAGAEALLREAIACFPDRKSTYNVLVDVYMAAHRWADGAVAAQQACTDDPLDFEMHVNWARCLLAAERPREAIAAVAEALGQPATVPAPIACQLLVHKGEAHRRLGDEEAAVDALVKALSLHPDDETALHQLSYLRPSLAKPYRARILETQAKQLPERLTDGLQALWQRARDHPLQSLELEWAWELADKSAWSRSEWQIAATWGKEASLFLRRWWESAPEKIDQIDALLDAADLSEVIAAMAAGRACLLVGAHVGPMAPGVSVLRAKLPFRTYGSANRDATDAEHPIPIVANRFATMRSLVDNIRNGCAIGLMGDVPRAQDSLSVEFLGRRVLLPALVPRLIQAHDLPAFWCCPLWRNGRAFLELERLPEPLRGEPRAEWSRRWFLRLSRQARTGDARSA